MKLKIRFIEISLVVLVLIFASNDYVEATPTSETVEANGLTDIKGEWRVKINIPIDPRFPIKKMGEVTVITVADGFNEYIKFNLPVNEHGDGAGRATVVLRPIKPDNRNEPSFDAEFHRFTVFGMLDYYAKEVGLVKQKQIQGAEGFGEVDMPWSATLNKQ